MNDLLFQPQSVIFLAQFLLSLAILSYLLSVRAKSQATWWLATAFAGLMLMGLIGFLFNSLFAAQQTPVVQQLTGMLNLCSTGLFAWAYLQFAYRFLENPFKREARMALGLTSLLWAADLGYASYVLFIRGSGNLFLYHGPLLLGLFIWATLVLLRKKRGALREASAISGAPRAYQTYATLNALAVVSLILIVLRDFGLFDAGWVDLLVRLTQLGFFFGIAVVYLNHAPEPTSFQVKLIGLSLVTVLALLTTVTEIMYPDNTVDEAVVEVPERTALQFTPDGQGGYEAIALPYHYESDLGDNLHLSDDSTKTIALGFSFPFYGEGRDSLYVSPNGAVTFDESIYRAEAIQYRSRYFYNDLPKIALLYIDLDPSSGGGVFLKRAPNRVVITWHEVPRFNTQDFNSVQLVLHQSGAIDFVYNHVDASLTTGLQGLTPGGTASAAASPMQDLPYRIAADTARIEDFQLAYRQRAHTEVKPLIWLVLGASFFVLVVFPFFFRSSLVKPLGRLLDGVQRVNAGDLEAEVPVGVRDEIGRLTLHFNRMTKSLQRYNGEMEALVTERTAQLEQSLRDLKATQAQLIQSEKMASLGQLTAGIAHEIKNPLNFVNNFAQLSTELTDEITEELAAHADKTVAEIREDLDEMLADLRINTEKIEEHGRRADGIVRAMMDHARGGGGERRAVGVNALVDEYVNLAYHGKRANVPDFNVTIEREYDEAVGDVEMMPQDIGRVFINLLNNAFDAVHERELSQNGQYAPTVKVSTRQVEGQVEIRVADNGSGIAEEIREKIFEPFFTTKPAGQGTGLGLSLSYDIVTQGHGGTMTVESKEGEGAAFVVALPR